MEGKTHQTSSREQSVANKEEKRLFMFELQSSSDGQTYLVESPFNPDTFSYSNAINTQEDDIIVYSS